MVQTELANDLAHASRLFVVLFPLAYKFVDCWLFGFCVNNVHVDGLLLQKSKRPMNRLDEVFEAVVNSYKNIGMAVALEIATGSGQLWLCRESLNGAPRQSKHPIFASLEI